jgi:nucleoside-diphosphate-sugar epimerase
MRKPEALIIGINNFLGRAIFELIKEDSVVTGVYNQNSKNIPDGIDVIQVDEIDNLNERSFKYVYLISSYVPRDNLVSHEDRLIDVNIFLPLKVCKLFPKARILFCSSVSIYENRYGDTAINIDERPSPLSKYALSKLWGERIIEGHHSYAIIRISSMYGIGMNTNTFLPRVINSVLTKRKINLLGDGGRMQNYIHVEDVAKIAVGAALHQDNLTLLAVHDKSYSNRDIAEKILELVPGTISFSDFDVSVSSVYNNDFTHSKIGSINFKNIKEGLKEVLEWIKKMY